MLKFVRVYVLGWICVGFFFFGGGGCLCVYGRMGCMLVFVHVWFFCPLLSLFQRLNVQLYPVFKMETLLTPSSRRKKRFVGMFKHSTLAKQVLHCKVTKTWHAVYPAFQAVMVNGAVDRIPAVLVSISLIAPLGRRPWGLHRRLLPTRP